MSLVEDMSSAVWDWLDADPAFAALGLEKFRELDGNALPFDRDGALAVDHGELPAIYCDGTGVDIDEEAATGIGQEVIVVEMPIGIVFDALNFSGQFPASRALDALRIVRRRLGSADARECNFDAAEHIDEYDISGIKLGRVPNPRNPRQILYWDAQLTLRLTKLDTLE